MNATRVAKFRIVLLALVALTTSSLLGTGASATIVRHSPVRPVTVAHVASRCDVQPHAGVQINTTVFPCLVTVKVGTLVKIAFDAGWHWSEPRSSSGAVQIHEISTSSNGAISAVVLAAKVGRATMASTGFIICKADVACPALARLWSVRFNVTGTAVASHTVTVTNSQSGQGATVHVGDHIVLHLAGSSLYSWSSPASSKSTVLRLDSSAMKSGDLRAVFTAVTVGTSRVSAVENPNCYPQCLPPSRIFDVAVTVVR
jgi:hypothetical protein